MSERAEQEIKRYKEAMQRAYDTTPEHLRPFIMGIARNMNVGTRQNPEWVTVEAPYMTVDGRVRWAMDECMVLDGDDPYEFPNGFRANVVIHPATFEQIGSQWVCHKTVECYRGKATGTIEIHFGGTGADETSPVANAETSALGRALGFLGYGLYGMGIASYDEVRDAMAQRERPQATPQASGEKPIFNPGGDATEKQLAYVRTLMAAAQFTPEAIDAYIPRLKTKKLAGDAIMMLKEGKMSPGSSARANAGTGEFNAPWQKVITWAEQHGIREKDLAGYVMSEYGETYPEAKKPADMPRSVAQSIEWTIDGPNAETFVDEIHNYLESTMEF